MRSNADQGVYRTIAKTGIEILRINIQSTVTSAVDIPPSAVNFTA